MLRLLLGFKPPRTQIQFPTAGPLLQQEKRKAKHAGYRQIRRPPTKPNSYCGIRVDQPNQSRKGIQEAASPSGEQLSQKEVDEKEEHQPTSKTSPVPCTTCER